MKSRASTDLKAFLVVQCAVVIVVSVVSGFLGSTASAASAFLSGCSVLFGNSVYVALLLRHQDRPSVVWIFVGQFAKVLVTVLCLMLVVSLYASLVWPGFLAGLFATLLVVFLAPIVMTRSQKKHDAVGVENILKTLSKD
jgi:F0F1-type ATP synthase assembly protein I